MNKLILDSSTNTYHSDNFTMCREHGKTPNGNDMNGRWALRDNTGALIDFDQYRSDLLERNNLSVDN